jgi:4-amino-4-deoxy-L-arabinose transferase-like glycosyltransferase
VLASAAEVRYKRWPMMPRKTFLISATCILIITAVLRLAFLGSIPPGLHFDEAANGVIVRNIAFDGYRPIFIEAYTGKEVLWFYTAALIMWLTGPTIFALRLTSALFGIVNIAAAGWLIRRLYPHNDRRDALALLTMAVLAIGLWQSILSRFADRAITQPLLQALSLGLLWQALTVEKPRQRIKWMALAGAVTGLSAYTYLAVRLFPIPLGIALFVFLIAGRDRLRRLPGLGVFLLSALIVFAPLGWFFVQHPEAFSTRIGQVAPQSTAEILEGWRLALRMLFLSGDPLTRFNLPYQPIFGPVLAIFFLVGLAVSIRDAIRARPPQDRALGALLIVWPVVMLAPTALAIGGITPSNLRAVGLAPLIALYPALGIVALTRAAPSLRLSSTMRRAIAPVALALTVLIGGASSLRDIRLWGTQQMLYYDNDSHIAALAQYLNQHSALAPNAYFATIHYRHPTLTFIAEDESSTRSLFGGAALVLAPSGETLAAYTRDARPPDDWQSWLQAHLDASPAGPDGTPDFAAYRFPPDAVFPVDAVEPANFANVITFDGLKLYPALSGAEAHIDVAWHIFGSAPAADYAFIAEACDAHGWCWVKANPDGTLERGVNNTYTSEQWRAGERLLTRINVPLPPGIPPGEYTVRVSIFSSTASARLPVIDENGGFRGFYAEAGLLVVEPNTNPDLDVPVQFPMDKHAAPGIDLLGYDLPVQTARTGEQIQLALYWHNLSDQTENQMISLKLGDTLLFEGSPAHDTNPISRWVSGELIVDRYNPRVPHNMQPGTYPLTVQIGENSVVRLSEMTIEAATRSFELPDEMIALDAPVIIGEQIALIGYQTESTRVAPGGTIDLNLVWRAEEAIPIGYTVFIHVIDADGNLITQMDRAPVVNAQSYPTDLWLSDEIVIDSYDLLIPANSIPGKYTIRVGLYVPESGQRLSIPGSADNAITLPITLTIQ